MATVSLALRGRGMVARVTAERIQNLAREMGYRPNPLLSSLAGKRFRSPNAVDNTPLAILNFPVLPHGEDRPGAYEGYLLENARSLGYAPTVWNLNAGTDAGRLYRTLYHRMVQGVVITGSVDAKEFGRAFDWESFSVVQCARFHTPQPFHIVRPNIFQAVKLVFTKMREMGYERIGFALGRHPEPMEDDEARYGAAISIEASYLARPFRVPVYDGPILDMKKMIAWVKRYRPEAVVGFSVGQYWALRSEGFDIPDELGFSSMHIRQDEDGFCSGLIQNHAEIARQSILLLDQLIRSRERGFASQPLHILVPSLWNPGTTLRRVGGENGNVRALEAGSRT